MSMGLQKSMKEPKVPKNKKSSRTNNSSIGMLYLLTKDHATDHMHLYTQTLTQLSMTVLSVKFVMLHQALVPFLITGLQRA